MPELVLYDIRLLAKQFLGTVLDIEVDQSDLDQSGYDGGVATLAGQHQTCTSVLVCCVDINTTGQAVIHSLHIVSPEVAVFDEFIF